VDCGQPGEILFLGEQVGLEGLQREVSFAPRSQIFSEPINRNVGSCGSRSVVDILIAASDRRLTDAAGPPAEAACSFRAGSRSSGRGDEITEAEALIHFADQNQATIGSDARSLEIDLQGRVEGRLKWLVLFLIH
jgi:hypothetical protein